MREVLQSVADNGQYGTQSLTTTPTNAVLPTHAKEAGVTNPGILCAFLARRAWYLMATARCLLPCPTVGTIFFKVKLSSHVCSSVNDFMVRLRSSWVWLRGRGA